MSEPVTSSSPSFDFDELLSNAIGRERRDYDDTEGYPFEPVPVDLPEDPPMPVSTPSPFGSPLSSATLSGPSRSPSPLNLPRLLNPSPICPTSSTTSSSKTTAKKKNQSKKNRAERRQRLKEMRGPTGFSVRQRIKENHVCPSKALVTTLDARKLRVASAGFVGLRDTEGVKSIYELSELIGKGSKWGFDLVTWDGR